jgi:hypothetical protein
VIHFYETFEKCPEVEHVLLYWHHPPQKIQLISAVGARTGAGEVFVPLNGNGCVLPMGNNLAPSNGIINVRHLKRLYCLAHPTFCCAAAIRPENMLHFEGQLPDNICLNVRPGGLEFLQTDCLPIEDPPNLYLYCTACCDRETQICLFNKNSK